MYIVSLCSQSTWCRGTHLTRSSFFLTSLRRFDSPQDMQMSCLSASSNENTPLSGNAFSSWRTGNRTPIFWTKTKRPTVRRSAKMSLDLRLSNGGRSPTSTNEEPENVYVLNGSECSRSRNLRILPLDDLPNCGRHYSMFACIYHHIL